MRRPLIVLLLGIASSTHAAELLEQIESDVFEATGTQRELAQRAKSCVAQNLRFDAVQLSDSTDGTDFLGSLQDDPFKAKGKTTSVDGGALLVAEDLDSGLITANNRVPFKALMTESVAQSAVTVLTKDDRFKIRHTKILVADLHTGLLRHKHCLTR